MSKLTRRQFGLASAAAISATSAIRLAHAAESPNEKMAVAVIGCGGRGGSHVGGFTGIKNAEITYLVDVDVTAGEAKARAVADRQGKKPKVVTDMRVALDDPSVDAISTATPNHWHALCGIWAMRAGKDAYIEKPICHNIMEGGDDGRPSSMGVHGRLGPRNAPTVWNSVFQASQFRDGRSPSLEDQAKGPPVCSEECRASS